MRITKTFCPGCRKPASIYRGKYHPYLRCTNRDCPCGDDCSIETFKRLIAEDEIKEENNK